MALPPVQALRRAMTGRTAIRCSMMAQRTRWPPLTRDRLESIMNETFSSDLRGPEHHDPRDRHSFNSEFIGASDSLIKKDRPALIGGRGWGGILLTIFIVFLPVFAIGGWAVWYF